MNALLCHITPSTDGGDEATASQRLGAFWLPQPHLASIHPCTTLLLPKILRESCQAIGILVHGRLDGADNFGVPAMPPFVSPQLQWLVRQASNTTLLPFAPRLSKWRPY